MAAPSPSSSSSRWRTPALETHIALPLFALLLLVAVWVVTIELIENARRAARLGSVDSIHELIETYEAQMARNLGAIDQTLKVIRYGVEMKGAQAALPALDEQGLLPSSLVFMVSVTDRDGRIVASNPPAPSGAQALWQNFRYHRDNDSPATQVSAPQQQAGSGEWRLHFTRRLNDANGHFAGIVVLEVDPAYFTSAYERSRLGEAGLLALVGEDAVVRAARSGDKLSGGQRAPSFDQTHSDAPVVTPWDGVRRYTSVRHLHGFPLSAVVGLSEEEQSAPFAQTRREYLWEAIGLSAILVLAGALFGAWSWQVARTRGRIRRAQETYAAASEASLDAFFVLRSRVDANGTITDFTIDDVNSRAEKMTGKSKQALVGRALCELVPEYRDNGIFDDLVNITRVGGVHEVEWENSAQNLPGRWLHRQVVGVEGGVVAIVRDISERKLSEERIRHMAHHDALTGLPNRTLIGDRLDQTILAARRNGSTVAVAFIDLDSFKLVNDGLGHNAGDDLLKVVGQRMVSCVRASDTVGRLGGDEFVIILSDQQDSDLAMLPVLDKIREAITLPILLDGQEVQVSCSMGVALYPRDGNGGGALLMNADAAMYRAKELGKNNCQFYTREMNASVEEKLKLLEGLRSALEEDQFRVLYQPKVDLRSGLIFGVEALIRWQHPEHGMVSPLRFIPLAEESGAIVAIGDWVLQTACRQLRAWQDAGHDAVTMSVNVSPRQFEDKRLVELVARALIEHRLGAGALELEVTESLIMRDLQQAIAKMRELEEMGVMLSIDDFGTGYSSLSALKSFPICRLKIDKSFVSDLAENHEDQAIAMAVISLGHKLGLRVIAEGVETVQQQIFLRENDCDEMQGYLFSKPVTAAEITAMLEAQSTSNDAALLQPSVFAP